MDHCASCDSMGPSVVYEKAWNAQSLPFECSYPINSLQCQRYYSKHPDGQLVFAQRVEFSSENNVTVDYELTTRVGSTSSDSIVNRVKLNIGKDVSSGSKALAVPVPKELPHSSPAVFVVSIKTRRHWWSLFPAPVAKINFKGSIVSHISASPDHDPARAAAHFKELRALFHDGMADELATCFQSLFDYSESQRKRFVAAMSTDSCLTELPQIVMTSKADLDKGSASPGKRFQAAGAASGATSGALTGAWVSPLVAGGLTWLFPPLALAAAPVLISTAVAGAVAGGTVGGVVGYEAGKYVLSEEEAREQGGKCGRQAVLLLGAGVLTVGGTVKVVSMLLNAFVQFMEAAMALLREECLPLLRAYMLGNKELHSKLTEVLKNVCVRAKFPIDWSFLFATLFMFFTRLGKHVDSDAMSTGK